MKKTLISLNLILLAHFFTINCAYCEEDFFTNSNFKEAKSQSKISQATKEKKGFFSKFKKEKKVNPEEQTGYYGTLPNISRDFAYKKQATNTTSEIDATIPTKDELDNENLKPAPFDDALFLDVIVKKEKTSDYVNDIQKTKYKDKSESLKESYIDILSTNYYAKLLGNLMYDANYYSRYIPTSQGKYSKENIANEQNQLLARINKTIFLINNES